MQDTIYLSNSFDITKYIDTRRFCIVWTYIVIEQVSFSRKILDSSRKGANKLDAELSQSVRGLSSAIRAKLMIVYYRVSTI